MLFDTPKMEKDYHLFAQADPLDAPFCLLMLVILEDARGTPAVEAGQIVNESKQVGPLG